MKCECPRKWIHGVNATVESRKKWTNQRKCTMPSLTCGKRFARLTLGLNVFNESWNVYFCMLTTKYPKSRIEFHLNQLCFDYFSLLFDFLLLHDFFLHIQLSWHFVLRIIIGQLSNWKNCRTKTRYRWTIYFICMFQKYISKVSRMFICLK